MGTKDPREGKLTDVEHFSLSVISTLDDSAQSLSELSKSIKNMFTHHTSH
jgi:hypothetical protein